MSTSITLRDVAAAAGVSIGTVDRILHKRGRYSKKSEEKVLAAIQDLNYQPSQIATALANRKKHLRIGICFVGPAGNEFNREILNGATAAARELEPFGVEIVMASTEKLDTFSQCEVLRSLADSSVDAIITLPFNDNAPTRDLAEIIPKEIPFATVTNADWNTNQLFHIGPDDVAMGELAAKLAILYSPKPKTVILAPNYELASTQKRVSGFINKLHHEPCGGTLVQICPIMGNNLEEIFENLSNKTEELTESVPDLNMIYLTNGFVSPVADKLIALQSSTQIICHEYNDRLPEYLEQNVVAASIYQKTAYEWYLAIRKMYRYLLNPGKKPSDIYSEYNIIIKETLPLVQIGNVYFEL